MPSNKVREFLKQHQIEYATLFHAPAYTAQEVAQSTHIPGREMAKTVMVKLDGQMALAVLPASARVDLRRLAAGTHAAIAEIATEMEFARACPGCEVGAAPPFGTLWGLPVYVHQSWHAGEPIAFNAGNHTEVMVVDFEAYEKAEHPTVLRFARPD